MPEQTYPPYVSGALTVPRQLNRWLDINPQNGFLSRTSTVITLPVFTTENSWNGYSNIVSSFNIESPNAISLKPFTAPSDPNYVLCVSYRIGNVVTRYMIWDATGSVMSQTIPFYVGQPLKKNFRFEVWNTSQGAVSQATEFKFYTSKLGSIDYRFGADYALATDGGQITAFTVSTSASSVALPTTNLFNRWKASTGISNTNWNSNYGTSNLFVGGNLGAITTAVDSSIQNNTVITNGETLLVTNTSLSPSALCVMYAVVKSF